ncbi:neuronal acetylcholine receptor subunit alpha-7-like isoform X2 [Anneissia japonica]|uniref:neuronal acetylcholine receptor subunit alpha-7-like isoform X2 n=1 Tax=Anneissia japonica TaxID=1529436 RepID=UPI00142571D5|nr:neuronal acetylcholine receptor subunit alpha-7-like isoform X2 [Anneissia japonica]
MVRPYFTFLVLVASLLSVKSVTITRNNATRITEALEENLGPSTNRPVLNSGTAVNVSLSFVLTQIIELNDMLQELKVAGWFKMGWQDKRISWNASEYNVSCVHINKDKIWIPDITLDNNLDEEYNQFLPNTPVQVCSDGSVIYATYAIFRSSCHINIKLFPYDNQTCKLRFSSWIHNIDELDMYPQARSEEQEVQFQPNGIWELINVNANREVDKYKPDSNPFVYAVFAIELKRHFEFQLLFILIPYFFCSFLICLMFFVPFESGEKLSYGITAVLGMIVFQQIIAFSLPPVGNESSIAGKYFTSVICIGIISVFVEIMVNNVYTQGNVYKACVYVFKYRKGEKKDRSGEENKSDSNHETVHANQQRDDTKHIKALQHYCAIFDFFFGILCLILIFIFMIWFLIVSY